ncbi:MAG: 16S rRNA (cytosine(1402)-N(4))-methyltransferase RsmH [Pseudomonadota bacterium]|nr:16S rRNA (cytosine(1402)-N(4))-methyltransferase RsmH [Pseudomonadota bacterium]
MDANPSRRVGHVPVLLAQVKAGLALQDNKLFVDGTFGRGGHSEALLQSARCEVMALDRDPAARSSARELRSRYGRRFSFFNGCFGDLDQILSEQGVRYVNGGVVLDLGVSSPQIDDAARGFSFQSDGPLDMRMGLCGEDAAGFINRATEGQLSDVIYNYGQERRARAVAREIVRERSVRAITRTGQLAEIVRKVVKKSIDGLDPATRTFQAIRIQINNELEELQRGLVAAERALVAGGRLVVVSFHSLEDRLVKTFLSERAGRARGSNRHLPAVDRRISPSFALINSRVIKPTLEERGKNPRSSSARLRAAERTEAPAWPMGAVV